MAVVGSIGMGATTPVWISGAESVAPAALTSLAKAVPAAGRIGVVYGFRVTSQEANAAGKIWRLRASIKGALVTVADVDVTNPSFYGPSPLFYLQGNGVDFYEVVNVVAGTALAIHQASILYGDQEV